MFIWYQKKKRKKKPYTYKWFTKSTRNNIGDEKKTTKILLI